MPSLSPSADATFQGPASAPLDLPATPSSLRWGVIDPDNAAVLHAASGDHINVETVSHHAGDAPDLMMDDHLHHLWNAIPDTQRGPGKHLITGPIHIEGAMPGDTLVVRIDSMTPRCRYGSNLAAHWGLLYPRFKKERVTVYELDESDREAFPHTARPAFGFDFTERELYNRPGFISWPDRVRREPFSRPVRVPVRPHFGIIGVAPKEEGARSTVQPGVFGGNVDNWRFGPGATLFLPVFRPGAGLYLGDPHFAQGDGEICGTAIEASANGTIRVAVARDIESTAPMLETTSHWYTHGFGADLDEAMLHAVEEMLKLLQALVGLSQDEAYSILSVAGDVGVTQVVDQVIGAHVAVARDLFG